MSRNGGVVVDEHRERVPVVVPVVAVVVAAAVAYLVVVAFVGGTVPGTGVETWGGVLPGLVALYIAPMVLFAVVWAVDRLAGAGRRRRS